MLFRSCNRNKPPARVRMERRGKSSPTSMVTWICCKPYPKQHRMRIVCPTHILRWHKPKLEAVWQHTAQIDNRPRQNPAYRQGRTKSPQHFKEQNASPKLAPNLPNNLRSFFKKRDHLLTILPQCAILFTEKPHRNQGC